MLAAYLFHLYFVQCEFLSTSEIDGYDSQENWLSEIWSYLLIYFEFCELIMNLPQYSAINDRIKII